MKKYVYKICLFFILILNFTHIVSAASLEENILITSDICLECREINDDVYTYCKDSGIKILNIDNSEDLIQYKELLEKYNLSKTVPLFIFNGNVYTNAVEINNLFNANSFDFKFLFLGFLDGFNPCAISILMIFISLLITLDKKKKCLVIGLSFILGETITNFLFGFGFINITNYLVNFEIILNIIYVISLVLCIFVFMVNLVDIFNGFRKKEIIKNQLSDNNKYRISSVIYKFINSRFSILMSLIMGMIIAILEFGCTGQLYLPSIIAMDNNLLYLCLYNIFFALPLIIFLFLSYILNKPEKIKSFIMKKSYLLKIIFNIVLVYLFFDILNRL